MLRVMLETRGRDTGSLVSDFWRAGCTEKCLSGSGRTQQTNQDEWVCGAASHEVLKVRVLSPLFWKTPEISQESFCVTKLPEQLHYSISSSYPFCFFLLRIKHFYAIIMLSELLKIFHDGRDEK